MRPKTRGDCVGAKRPCRWSTCRHHVDAAEHGAHHRVPKNGQTCTLDVADIGDHSCDEVGEVLGLSGERVRQVEEQALRKLHVRAIRGDAGARVLLAMYRELE